MIVPPDPNLLDSERHLSDKPPLRDDTHFAAGRIAVFQYCAVAIFLLLVAGFWRLQVQNPEFYNEKAFQNSVKSEPLVAPRGRILDRDGRVIVDNHSSFSLYLVREALKEEHLPAIAQGLDLDYDLAARVHRYRGRAKYEMIPVKSELSSADLSFVDSHKDFFPELFMVQSQQRVYPQGGVLAHVIGYTGEISDSELDMPEFAKFDQGQIIGKFGVERQYNDLLTGEDGQRQVIVDSRGQVQGPPLRITPAKPGKDLKLTIDLDLQAVGELALEGKTGALVSLDPRTGEVLAMVSHPSFDPNKLGAHKSKDWAEVLHNPDNPLMNRAIQAQSAPGSTFKPIVALAALENGTIDENFTVHCSGGAYFYGTYRHCDLKTGHGAVNLHGGLVHSCDVYFYTVGDKLGIDKIAQYATMVGFGQPTGIDLPNENHGVVPSPQWKLRNFRDKWYAGETISVAIGQGALTVTPLQLARAYAGLVEGGVWRRPHLVQTKEATDKASFESLDPDVLRKIYAGLYGVVNEGGTGTRARLPGITVCGKTGTAQVMSADLAKSLGGKESKDNSWFIAYAPCENPEIVTVAFVQHGGWGADSAPLVRDVMKSYFDKKMRMANFQLQRDAMQQKAAISLALFPSQMFARSK